MGSVPKESGGYLPQILALTVKQPPKAVAVTSRD